MSKLKKLRKVLVIHGPNLNMLGKREPAIYGKTTLNEINKKLKNTGKNLEIAVDTFQSNHEGEIVEKIQDAMGKCQGIIINPAAYTHTSIAIRDALLLLDIPIIEIHLSNIYKREPFVLCKYLWPFLPASLFMVILTSVPSITLCPDKGN